MNRRDFLKSLAALGAAFTIPLEALAVVSDADVDEAWQAAIDEPFTFYASESGTLSYSGSLEYPTSRLDLFRLNYFQNLDELITASGEDWRIAAIIQNAMDEAGDGDSELCLKDWINQRDAEAKHALLVDANAYLDDSADEIDWEKADLEGYSDRGAAMAFFRDQFEYNELFNIVIVEGCHPGSTYYAAELRMPIDEANAIARREGIPIRFGFGES